MRYPNIWTVHGIFQHLCDGPENVASMLDGGVHWFPARPLGMPTLGNRIRAAWLVFIGRADAVEWPYD